MSYLPVIIVAAILAIVVLRYLKKKKKYKDIHLDMPEEKRNDLLYGYYSSLDRSYEQTKDHINLFWYSHFFGYIELVKILKETTCKVVVDLAPLISERQDNKIVAKQDREESLRQYFTYLKNDGVLHKIHYLYPSDEPNLFVKDAQEHLKMILTVKKVAQEFPELEGVRIAVIYGRGKPFWNIEHFDVVGVDDYDQKSEVLTIGEHARLKAAMVPGQKTMIVPGCGFGQNPDPFVAYAHINKDEVEMVVPFIWFDDPNHKDVPYTGLEAADPAFRAKWIEAAYKVMNKQ